MSNNNRNNPEILAPAGSIETLYAAIAMGADAVYVGAPRYGARAFAHNPSVDELRQAIIDCHLRGKRLYLTTNTLMTDAEIGYNNYNKTEMFGKDNSYQPEAKADTLISMLEPLVEAGLDAAIVQDPGVLVALHKAFPTLSLHASTQMALFSGEEAELLRPYGVTRFVPARELTIDEIKTAREQTDLEIEVFVHGALCVCYSGWCLMSEHIGGRSGNRGMCAGPCRLPYKRNPEGGEIVSYAQKAGGTVKHGQSSTRAYELNAKDQETLLHIPELVDAGIDSFKIEGRMKSREYASYIAYLYRHYTDVYLEEGADHYRKLIENKDSALWQDRKKAMELYNRGGFYSSFLFAKKNEPTIESRVKGHYGLPVGEVTCAKAESVKGCTVQSDDKKGKSSVTISLSEEIYRGDVLAVRDEFGETVYEFTVGETLTEGQQKKAGNGDVDKEMTEITVPVGFAKVKSGYQVFRTKNNMLLSDIDKQIEDALLQDTVGIGGRWTGRIGEPVEFEVKGRICDTEVCSLDKNAGSSTDDFQKEISVTVTGDELQPAAKRPVTSDDVRERLSSLGGSGYRWETLEVDMADGAFIPLKAIKELRRKAIAAFEQASVKAWKEALKADPWVVEVNRPSGSGQDSERGSELSAEDYRKKTLPSVLSEAKKWIAVQTMEQLEEVLIFLYENQPGKTVLHVKLSGFPALSYEKIHTMWKDSKRKKSDIVWAFSLPRAWRGKIKQKNEKNVVDFFSYMTDYYNSERNKSDFAENSSMTAKISEIPFIFVANSMASIVFRNRYLPEGILTIADENLYMWNIPAEHFYERISIYPGPKRIYGRIPVMTTAHEITEGEIETPKGDRFIVSKPEGTEGRIIYTADAVSERSYEGAGLVDFSTENVGKVREILRSDLCKNT